MNDKSLTGSKNGYSGQIISHREGADRFYPVRIYDGKGKLKREISTKQVRNLARKTFGKGQHWKQTAPK